MPDITMCKDDECPWAKVCHRHEATPSVRQAYFVESPRQGDKCEYLWRVPAERA